MRSISSTFSEFSVVFAFVHLFTMFMIVPILSSMMRIDRSSLEAASDATITLPLELQGLITTVTNPPINALGTQTTLVSFVVMGVTIAAAMWLRRGRI